MDSKDTKTHIRPFPELLALAEAEAREHHNALICARVGAGLVPGRPSWEDETPANRRVLTYAQLLLLCDLTRYLSFCAVSALVIERLTGKRPEQPPYLMRKGGTRPGWTMGGWDIEETWTFLEPDCDMVFDHRDVKVAGISGIARRAEALVAIRNTLWPEPSNG